MRMPQSKSLSQSHITYYVHIRVNSVSAFMPHSRHNDRNSERPTSDVYSLCLQVINFCGKEMNLCYLYNH